MMKALYGTIMDLPQDDARFFMPVCLYSQVLKCRCNIELVLRPRLEAGGSGLLLVCDEIHALNLQMRHGLEASTAIQKAEQQGLELTRMLRHLLDQNNWNSSVHLHRWRDLSRDPDYQRIRENMGRKLDRCLSLSREVDRFVETSLLKFGGPDSSSTLERNYLLSEMAMTMFIAEFKSCRLHLWERLPTQPDPDPIGLMYRDHLDFVRLITGKDRVGRCVSSFGDDPRIRLHSRSQHSKNRVRNSFVGNEKSDSLSTRSYARAQTHVESMRHARTPE
ncbi:MAG: hypothetical protein O7G85_03660 [Planctomycetota bacterium]|nr:hypothetical protein [Planctomycetota bacterium]